MKKIKLFSAQNIQALESDINKWLATHKGIHIIETNITGSPKEHAFYILYTPEEVNEEVSVIAAAKQLPSELIEPGNLLTEIN